MSECFFWYRPTLVVPDRGAGMSRVSIYLLFHMFVFVLSTFVVNSGTCYWQARCIDIVTFNLEVRQVCKRKNKETWQTLRLNFFSEWNIDRQTSICMNNTATKQSAIYIQAFKRRTCSALGIRDTYPDDPSPTPTKTNFAVTPFDSTETGSIFSD